MTDERIKQLTRGKGLAEALSSVLRKVRLLEEWEEGLKEDLKEAEENWEEFIEEVPVTGKEGPKKPL